MKTTRFFLLSVLLLTPFTASAAHYADFYVVPVVSHVNGFGGTLWRSDVMLQNFQTEPITVDFVYVESGLLDENVNALVSNSLPGASVEIAAGGSVLVEDLLNGYMSANEMENDTLGALLVGSDQPFAAVARNYADAGAGTMGVGVPAVRDFLETLTCGNSATAVSYLPGLRVDDQYRTNLGFVIGSAEGQPATVTVALRNREGATLGTKSFTFAGSEIRHIQMNSGAIAQAAFDIGSAEYRITSGDAALVPYATVIDNATADSVFVLGALPGPPQDCAAFKSATQSAPQSVFRRIFEQHRNH